MAALPTAHTYVTGEVVTAATLNGSLGATVAAYQLTPPVALLRQTVAQTLTNAVLASITFDVEDLDSDNGHSTISNTSRYVMQNTGWYLVSGMIAFVANATGSRRVFLAVNGTVLNGSETSVGAATAGATCTPLPARLVQCTAAGSDYVELQTIQGSGGNLNTQVSGTQESMLSVWRASS